MKAQILFILAVVSFTGVQLNCPPPPQGHPDLPPDAPPPVCRGPCKCSTANCPGGLVTGVCDCDCAVCAKQKDECCGGWMNYQGKCDVGLVCLPGPAPPGGPPPPPGPGGSRRSMPGVIPNPGTCVLA